jgi:4-amino-4-deoxy-L-arabinose transferase-like glycosyltransferase
LAVVVALGAVGAIIGVVARYNGRALPDWPHDITLNALIALLATFANATISVSRSPQHRYRIWRVSMMPVVALGDR